MNIKLKLITLTLIGTVCFAKNLQEQSSQQVYKDSSQTITREELIHAQEVNKVRKDKARDFKKSTKATKKKDQVIRDSLYNINEKRKPAEERS